MNLSAVIVIAIGVAMAAAAAVVGLPALAKQKNESLIDQIAIITSASSTAISRAGAGAIVDVAYLTDNDFLPKGNDYSDGVGQLLNGGSFTTLGNATTNQVTATFALDDAEQCGYISASQTRFFSTVDGSTTCSTAGLLTLVVTR